MKERVFCALTLCPEEDEVRNNDLILRRFIEELVLD